MQSKKIIQFSSDDDDRRIRLSTRTHSHIHSTHTTCTSNMNVYCIYGNFAHFKWWMTDWMGSDGWMARQSRMEAMPTTMKSIFELEFMIVIRTYSDVEREGIGKTDDVCGICSRVAKRRRKWILMWDYHSFYNTLVRSLVRTILNVYSFGSSISV